MNDDARRRVGRAARTTERARAGAGRAKAQHQRRKVRRKAQRQRRDAAMRAARQSRARAAGAHRAAVTRPRAARHAAAAVRRAGACGTSTGLSAHAALPGAHGGVATATVRRETGRCAPSFSPARCAATSSWPTRWPRGSTSRRVAGGEVVRAAALRRDRADDEAVIARHFDARDASEDAFFAGARRACAAPSRRVPPGGCNDPGGDRGDAARWRRTSCWCSAPAC